MPVLGDKLAPYIYRRKGQSLPLLTLNARTGRSPTAIGLGRFVAAPLHGIKSNDPAIAALSITMLAAAAALADLIPARRASRIDAIACPPLRLRSGIAADIISANNVPACPLALAQSLAPYHFSGRPTKEGLRPFNKRITISVCTTNSFRKEDTNVGNSY
jgi:hypothetical protein